MRVPWLDSSISAPSAPASAKQGHSGPVMKGHSYSTYLKLRASHSSHYLVNIDFCWCSGAIISSKKKVLEEKTTNVRASPILRPRAVLSSPGFYILIV